ncbi:helix-turn-helix domain-containing protein [Aliarcobacter butzleri]|uniref:helix-turn-helix domain-containing protein n=1 Tax=Aliarcobacter butzleri TaxID=28197 RepID=UPI001260F798|nr:helix-turn-helix domain-containing protein [Aliarcobacter butzleri]
MNNSDSKKLIKKIKTAYQISTNPELANKLKLTVSAIEQWSKKNKVPEKYIFQCITDTGVSLQWLLDEDQPTFHISGGTKNISQVNGGTINQSSRQEDELELFEEFKKIENLAKMTKKMDFLKKEIETIKEELKRYI